MIEIFLEDKDTLDNLLKKYKKKLEKINFIKKQKERLHFEKKSDKRKKEIQRAIIRERYKRIHGLV